MTIETSKDSILEEEINISLLDRVKMQKDLMIQMNMSNSQEEKQKWINMYAKYFKDIELVRPELVVGYFELEDGSQIFQERLSMMHHELEDLAAKNS